MQTWYDRMVRVSQSVSRGPTVTLSGPARVIPLASWKGQYDSGVISGRCHNLYVDRELKPEITGNTYEEEPDPNQIPLEGYSEHSSRGVCVFFCSSDFQAF